MKDNTVREELIERLKGIELTLGCDVGVFKAYDVPKFADFILDRFIPKSAIEPLKTCQDNDSWMKLKKAIDLTLTNCGEKI